MILDTKYNIPFYKDINAFYHLSTRNFQYKILTFFVCLCIPIQKMDTYKTAFKKNFYYTGLVTNAGNTKITYDATSVTDLNSFLVFQSPALLYSFMRDPKANGYLIYFKKDLFSFFKPVFENEFPMFDILQTNFFKLNQAKFKQFEPYFKSVFDSYNNTNNNQNIAVLQLLTLLYQLKEFTKTFNQVEESFNSPQQLLH